MSADEPQQTALSTPRFTAQRLFSRGEIVAGWLGLGLNVLAILVGFALPHVLPDGKRLSSHLSDIGLLLFIAGSLLFLASRFLSDRQQQPDQWPAQWCRLRQFWSLRFVVVGAVLVAVITAWQSIADLGIPPNPNGPSMELPGAANVLLLVRVSLGLPVLAVPEYIWRSWRERRASREMGQSEK